MADPMYPTIHDGYLEVGSRMPRQQPRQLRPEARTHPHRGWGGNIDTYDLQDPEYDPDAWYVGPRGADGRQRTISVRVPEHLSRAMDEIVAKQVFPIVKTPSDFIRSAIVHELHRRIGEVRDPNFSVDLSAHTSLEQMLTLMAEFEAQQEFVERTHQQLERVKKDPRALSAALDVLFAAIDSGKYGGDLYEELVKLAQEYGRMPNILRPVE